MDTPPLETKVALLRQPDTYPDKPDHVEAVETHMSWVFLTDRYAYKLKKPVHYDMLDFSTLALRQQDCEEEVRLNRRLAPDVYLGTVPLTVDSSGAMQLGADGEVIEWLVKMRRLPSECMLDQAIQHDKVDEADIHNVALKLSRFFRECSPVELPSEQYRAEFEKNIELNRRELLTPDYELPQDVIRKIHDDQIDFLRRESGLLDSRAAAKKIVEGHGDLRPEHICLEPDPVIIDCLEFYRPFRITDPADELSFLAMECDRLGAPFIGKELFRTYENVTHDQPPSRLQNFYKAYRACLRARLAIWHTRELEKQDWPKWQDRAREYLLLAETYCAQLSKA
jgi:aminoglycoside phosphotransferase family enzyme